eukprot:TRINITY_DN5829_c0_g1_i1.p1 TRINITY_DN5829_c0_g1~~TRINITY_DN5829_c0_g1_i1.p1  ORF type:complete len:1285 (-),score=266.80 TRINITY_DN5829_c0_g1_i1:255-4109(-)
MEVSNGTKVKNTLEFWRKITESLPPPPPQGTLSSDGSESGEERSPLRDSSPELARRCAHSSSETSSLVHADSSLSLPSPPSLSSPSSSLSLSDLKSSSPPSPAPPSPSRTQPEASPLRVSHVSPAYTVDDGKQISIQPALSENKSGVIIIPLLTPPVYVSDSGSPKLTPTPSPPPSPEGLQTQNGIAGGSVKLNTSPSAFSSPTRRRKSNSISFSETPSLHFIRKTGLSPRRSDPPLLTRNILSEDEDLSSDSSLDLESKHRVRLRISSSGEESSSGSRGSRSVRRSVSLVADELKATKVRLNSLEQQTQDRIASLEADKKRDHARIVELENTTHAMQAQIECMELQLEAICKAMRNTPLPPSPIGASTSSSSPPALQAPLSPAPIPWRKGSASILPANMALASSKKRLPVRTESLPPGSMNMRRRSTIGVARALQSPGRSSVSADFSPPSPATSPSLLRKHSPPVRPSRSASTSSVSAMLRSSSGSSGLGPSGSAGSPRSSRRPRPASSDLFTILSSRREHELSTLSNIPRTTSTTEVVKKTKDKRKSLRFGKKKLDREVITAMSKTFGVPLEDIPIPHGSTIPPFLERALTRLSTTECRSTPHLFAYPVSPNDVQNGREDLDSGKDSFLDSAEPHLVAELIVTFLDELPVPVIPEDHALPFLEAMDLDDSAYRMCVLRTIFLSMPKSHRAVFRHVLTWLKGAMVYKEDNQMSPEHVSDVFAPLLFRLKEESGSYTCRASLSTEKMTTMYSEFASEADRLERHPDAAAAIPPADTTTPTPSSDGEPTTISACASLSVFRSIASLLVLFIEHADDLCDGLTPTSRYTYNKETDAHRLLAGTLDSIVDHLLNPHYDDERHLASVLLSTHSYYVKPDELLSLLFKRLCSCSESPAWDTFVRARVLRLTKRWLQDFVIMPGEETPSCDAVSSFIEVLERDGCSLDESVYTSFFQMWIDGQRVAAAKRKGSEAALLAASMATARKSGSTTRANQNMGVQLLDLNPAAVARTLTLTDHNLFVAVPTHEFMHEKYMDALRSPSMAAMVRQFNKCGRWITSETLVRDAASERAEILAYFINVATECLALQNFNACFALVGGLNSAPISRLKMTWEKVPKVEMKRYKKLTSLCDVQLNQGNYRRRLQSASKPLIPHLAVFTKDLFSIETNNPDNVKADLPPADVDTGCTAPTPASSDDAITGTIDSDESSSRPPSGYTSTASLSSISLINLAKFELLADQLSSIHAFQKTSYPNLIPDQAAATYINQVGTPTKPFLDETDGFKRSLTLEPRK